MAKQTGRSTRRDARKADATKGQTGLEEADRLVMAPFDRKKIEKAVDLLTVRLDEDPEDVLTLWRIARAWVRLLEHQTGTVLEERPEYQPVLDDLGKRALEMAEQAHELAPSDADAIGWHMAAYGYYSISIGIIRAVLQGAAGKYLRLAGQLNEVEPSWLSGAGYRAMGRFYREAPWPKRDVKRSVECFRKAVELGPRRLENRLHLALALTDSGQGDEARSVLSEVVKGKPEESEAHFHAPLVEFARTRLARIGG